MRFIALASAAIMAAITGVSAQGDGFTAIVQTFDSVTCNGLLGSAAVTENSCVSTQGLDTPFPIGSFKIVGSALATDCRVVFHNDDSCSFRGGSFIVLEPSPEEMGVGTGGVGARCFNALDFGVFDHDFLGIFCS
ncbi:hypothetical protein QBC34DRAFT_383235 [Podospora aff. communis PSN243]|uniref:Uncharacterized protein n=1 Tax=Podospora aff. communis PSN243 TaxID=3040156 RepID=A0AAV9GGD1_9PEZI|nr:hypothetical protein QBC34DRAFT_383235 [Podospora aff. communis PSN243]